MNNKLLILLFFFAVATEGLSAQGYLVLKTGDTVRFKGEVDVPSEKQAEWTMIGIGQKIYLIDQIDHMVLKESYLKVIKQKFYKRVITGRISVYALSDEDTIPNANGYVKHRLFIQGSDNPRPKRISNYRLHQMMKDPVNIEVRKRSRYSVVAVPFLVYGAPGTVSSLIILGVAAVSTHLRNMNVSAGFIASLGVLGLTQTSIYMVPGAILFWSGRRVSLKPIYNYNTR